MATLAQVLQYPGITCATTVQASMLLFTWGGSFSFTVGLACTADIFQKARERCGTELHTAAPGTCRESETTARRAAKNRSMPSSHYSLGDFHMLVNICGIQSRPIERERYWKATHIAAQCPVQQCIEIYIRTSRYFVLQVVLILINILYHSSCTIDMHLFNAASDFNCSVRCVAFQLPLILANIVSYQNINQHSNNVLKHFAKHISLQHTVSNSTQLTRAVNKSLSTLLKMGSCLENVSFCTDARSCEKQPVSLV